MFNLSFDGFSLLIIQNLVSPNLLKYKNNTKVSFISKVCHNIGQEVNGGEIMLEGLLGLLNPIVALLGNLLAIILGLL
ncbi:hypothetical protein GCM10025860_06400 [Methanobacterium ferruginis]|nr:hypothetical protein GCM10025860_06400 [Methanobacterium ferruginis]